MYSDFYKIPLPALRFEKVEETDTKKVKNDDTEEKQRLFQNSTNVKEAKRKRRSKEKQNSLAKRTTRKRGLSNASRTKSI